MYWHCLPYPELKFYTRSLLASIHIMTQVVSAGSQAHIFVSNPLERYYDGPGQTVVGAENAMCAIREFQEKVTRIESPRGDVFIYESEATGFNTKTYTINIGPVGINFSVDLDTFAAMVEVYLSLIWTKVQIAKASGNLRDGITLNIGYPHILSGTLRFELEDGDVVLNYDFDVFSHHYNGRIVIFHI
ncbi:hypothetical protein V8B97DRAFT_1980585 [Scleroderma yunnanense]